jgi:hypothetical protein
MVRARPAERASPGFQPRKAELACPKAEESGVGLSKGGGLGLSKRGSLLPVQLRRPFLDPYQRVSDDGNPPAVRGFGWKCGTLACPIAIRPRSWRGVGLSAGCCLSNSAGRFPIRTSKRPAREIRRLFGTSAGNPGRRPVQSPPNRLRSNRSPAAPLACPIAVACPASPAVSRSLPENFRRGKSARRSGLPRVFQAVGLSNRRYPAGPETPPASRLTSRPRPSPSGRAPRAPASRAGRG